MVKKKVCFEVVERLLLQGVLQVLCQGELFAGVKCLSSCCEGGLFCVAGEGLGVRRWCARGGGWGWSNAAVRGVGGVATGGVVKGGVS